MLQLTTASDVTVSYDRYGNGPPLVLVHGSFSDHESNWAFVKPLLERQFTIHAIARRGRGGTDRTEGHSLEDEGSDVAAVIQAIDQPVFLLGHSYGAHAALIGAEMVAARVRKLVLYEPPWPHIFPKGVVPRLAEFAQAEDWESLAMTFFHEVLSVPRPELEALRTTEHWPPIIADSQASLGDLRAVLRYEFRPARFRELRMPVLLQVGAESPRNYYVTDALAAVLLDARVEALSGQAHEGMTTAPEMYAEALSRFLLA